MPIDLSHGPVTLNIEHRIARLQLNQPERRNALGCEALERIEHALEFVEADQKVRVLILSATPAETFCAGAALDEISEGLLTPARFHACLDRLSECSRPTVAAISGNVYGGGAELPLACDFRIGVTGLRLQVPATRIGLCYPPQGIQRYTRQLGAPAAKRILLAGETCNVETLLTMGYLSEAVSPEALADTVTHFAHTLADCAPLAMRAVKQLIDAEATNTWDREIAQAWQTRCDKSLDLKRGLEAARLKRAPDFQGD